MLPCPRRSESLISMTDPSTDVFREDGTCSYCGSLNPETLMRDIESGTVELGPTDKSYKVYLNYPGKPVGKFYFQHMSEAQMKEFVDMYNGGKLRIGFPGRFYRLPFFMGIEKKSV